MADRAVAVLTPLPGARPRPAAAALAALCLLGGLAGQAAAELVPVPPPPFPAACDDLDPQSLIDAIEREAAAVARLPAAPGFRFGDRTITPADYASTTLRPLAELARRGAEALCAELPRRFAFYKSAGAGPGKFTAYHNPLLAGSRTRHHDYQHPLYRRPPGALAKLPTADILAGALDGKGLELIYLRDATEALGAHVEGSATVQLDDGGQINVGSDGHNGLPYTNVSKLLLADGKIPKDQVTPIEMTRARKYFLDHPGELAAYWGKNPHFVFFKPSPHRGGGKFGELVPGRSLAVDPAQTPLGLALYIRTDKPAIAANKVQSWVPFGRVALAQDTGAGIVGPGRVDVFFGTGDYAAQASAVTTRPGEVYVLLAR